MLKIPPMPDKEYFSIGEVSQITLVSKHILRYWEREFNLLHPIRKSSGQRRYRVEEVELIFKIKDLLYNKKYTISGAKKYLVGDKRKKLTDLQTNLDLDLEHVPDSRFLRDLKHELQHILKLLKSI
ncbi:MAG: MerR family transcriptional regulator [Endomicrobium sp.]|jgi:DNA-binding transcriptional MerR regulator|nr:MerR family transcriptional regulator [Endomicrobium sp.]